MPSDKFLNPPTLYDPLDMDSLEFALTLIPPDWRARYDKADKELKVCPDEELAAKIGVTHVDRMLRLNFWKVMDECRLDATKKFMPINLYKGICSNAGFYNKIHEPERLCFILRPLQVYDKRAEEIVDFGMTKLRDALSAKLVYSNGHLDAKATKVVLDIVSYFEARTKGRVPHSLKVDSKTQNLTANIDVQIGAKSGDLKELDSKLDTLKKQLAQYTGETYIQNIPELTREINEDEAEFVEAKTDSGAD